MNDVRGNGEDDDDDDVVRGHVGEEFARGADGHLRSTRLNGAATPPPGTEF